jgi:hypothetical protein
MKRIEVELGLHTQIPFAAGIFILVRSGESLPISSPENLAADHLLIDTVFREITPDKPASLTFTQNDRD